MGEVSLETSAYAKIILHAAKYPHCAVNGVLLADGSNIKSGNKNQDLDIVDSIPLFHHSHYVSPMAEIALTQIELQAQQDNRVIAGYYAACENFRDNTVEKCPGQKIAEKIVEYFPSAVFIVVDNKRMVQNLDTPAIKIHKYSEGKWKPKDANKVLFQSQYVLETVSHLLQRRVQKDLVDFDNYLDDSTQDWTNLGIEKLIASINASNAIDKEKDSE
ncbi:ER membrane protein complex subunit 8/9 homolog [Bicyclus anynana]|uniref:ER membrane protein complex subunit 8/9 homolog n=1 Tax=Bicyclus anynana TaxID=110368 RepID=A0ABM3LRT8_BICAN|nr:ER membrane protein complex subunit 8/9 homolog [Bicyclus anynana]XP_052741796.1 ER membrane protein complex subunit 8/9 homolog [Bicyclus anynana]